VTKTGQIIETKTSDDIRKLAAVAPDGIIMAEAAQQDYESYLRCVGRVAERRGWLLMSGTFEGSLGWYAEMFNNWESPINVEGGVAYSLPSWENQTIYPGGRNDPEILRLERVFERVEGLFEERIGARPIPPHNLVFREFRTRVHVNPKVVFDPLLPVYLGVDPSAGSNPYAVLACQFHPHLRETPHPDPIDYCYIIDELYETGKIGEEVIALAMKKPWWKNVKGGAIDEEAPDERKRWLRIGHLNLVSKKIPQLNGIRREKSFLYFNPERKEPPHIQIASGVKGITFEYGHYKRDVPKDEDHEMKAVPRSDQPNHSIKALWYLLIARYGDVKGKVKAAPVKTWHPRH